MKKPYSILLEILFLLLSAGVGKTKQPVEVKVETVTMPTYLLGPQEKHPMFKDYRFPGEIPFRSRRLVYPYTLQDEFTREKKDVAYESVVLENEYIKVLVIPDLRGRIQAAIDKRNGWDFLYHNHVIKPADIAIRQAWISGGLEWNHPQGHGYTQFDKISYKIIDESDGSKTVLIAEIEPNRMMKWEAAITLRPGRLFVETTERFTSLVDYPIPFVSFQNAAMHATELTETIYPKGTWITLHGKHKFMKWPYLGNIDLSYYKNLKGPLSVFAEGQGIREDFFGVYAHDKNAGTVIVADHRKAPGKKYFSWGASPDGRVWDRLLSDSDGPYLELQLGAFWDNLGYGYSWLDPLEQKEFTAYWYPVKDIGGFVTASKDLALNVKRDNNKIFVGIQSTRDFSNLKLLIYSDEQVLLEKSINLRVSKPFKDNFSLPQNVDFNKLKIRIVDSQNKRLIQYSTAAAEVAPPQVPKRDKPVDQMTTDELYNKAKSFYQDPFGPDAERYYMAILKKDSLECRANLDLGVMYYHRGQYDKAKHYLRNVLLRDPLNGMAYKAHLYLGIVEFEEGDYEKAREELKLASRFAETTGQALYYLGKIDLTLHDYVKAVSFFKEALNTAGNKAEIWASIAIAYRKAGMEKEARQAISEALKEDPLEFTAITEQWFWGEITDVQLNELFDRRDSTFIGSQLYIEQACKYIEIASWSEAADILKLALSHFESTGKVYPMLAYYLGYVHKKMGELKEAERYYTSASKQNSDYVFPYRKLSVKVLRSSLSYNARDANGWLYLGNLLTYLRRHKEGLAAWEKAYKFNSQNPVLLRNLAHAVWYVHADTAQTISYLSQACKTDPLDTQLFLDLDRVYDVIGAEKQRVERFESNASFVQNNDVLVHRWVTLLLRLGYKALYQENLSRAFSYFKKAKDLMMSTYFFPREGSKKVHERYAEACYGLAEILLKRGKSREALAQVQQGREYPDNLNVGRPAYPVRSRAFYLMGLAYEQLNDSANAKKYFLKAATEKILPETESIYYKALALKKLSKVDEADELLIHTTDILEKAVDHGKEELSPVSLYVLSKIYSLLGDSRRAENYRSRALKKDPDVVLNARIEASVILWEGRHL